jgi:CheY-like chemotaxis protein
MVTTMAERVAVVRVRCARCVTEFDAMQAEWCRCVTKNVSPACPSCNFCLCKAPAAKQVDFWFRAPKALADRRDAEQQRRAVEAELRKRAGAVKKTVLIVDDDEEIRALADYALQQMGFRTMTASAPDEALRLLSTIRPDVVLTDALMPKMDGRELCRRIKNENGDVKVVVMTSLYTAPRYRTEAFTRFHADEYVAKPIDFARLQTILEKLAA